MSKRTRTAAEPIAPEQMAAGGDVAGLLQFIRERPLALDLRMKIHLLRVALAAAARDDFDASVRTVYQLMIGFTADLLVISQTVAARRVEQMEREVNGGNDTFVRDSLETVLPQIERLHQHLITLTRAYATTNHTQRLGRRRAQRERAGERDTVVKLVRETEDGAREGVQCG